MIEDLSEIQSWAGLERYIKAKTNKTIAASFVRLTKDSLYDWKNKRFRFESYHSHYTIPRLREIANSIGIIFMREVIDEEPTDYYYWDITQRLDSGLKSKILKLKFLQYQIFLNNLPF